MNTILFDILTFNTLFSAVLVINSVNPIFSVLFLISVFINASLFLILKGIGFIGLSYIIVYVGAITVLFLFVIMMININIKDIIETGNQYTKNIPLIFSIALLFIYEISKILPYTLNDVTILTKIGEIFNKINLVYFNSVNTFTGKTIFTLPVNNTSLTEVFIFFKENIGDLIFIKFLQIESIGQSLYTLEAIELFIISIILLLSMVTPIFISRKSNFSYN